MAKDIDKEEVLRIAWDIRYSRGNLDDFEIALREQGIEYNRRGRSILHVGSMKFMAVLGGFTIPE